MADAERDDVAPQPGDPLPIWQRIVFATVGIAGLCVGTTATFVTKNSVGCGVMLAIGALFVVIGITGNPITRAKFGDNEVTFGLRRALTRVLAAADPDVKKEAAEAVLETDLPVRDPLRIQATRVQEALAYERETFDSLKRALGDFEFANEWDDNQLDVLVNARGKRLGILTSYTYSGASYSTRSSAVANGESLLKHGHSGSIDGIIIIANQPTEKDIAQAERIPRMELIVWQSPQDDEKLVDAVDRLL